MKEIVGIIVTIGLILGGNAVLKQFHDSIKKAALEKASEGLPSLTKMTRSLQKGDQLREKKKNR